MEKLLKRQVKRVLHGLGLEVVSFRRKMGYQPRSDMRKFLHNDHPLILDVGANKGQSIESFHKSFPNCTVHSFEPSPTTFEELKHRASRFENAHLWNFALGSTSGRSTFLENEHSDMSSFLPLSEYGWGTVTKQTPVEVKTIDAFCRDENIEQIDILKSDTQGYDLEVFKGAEETIRNNKIGLIYFEVIFSDMYENLPSFSEIYEFLTSRGFLLVSFYGFRYQEKLASWADALFVSQAYLEARRQQSAAA